MKLFHGSDHIIEAPFALDNRYNDYGPGFYCTEEETMAGEWACKWNKDGVVNVYDFSDTDLKVLNLLDGQHTVLNWVALLLQFRFFKLDYPIALCARQYLIDHFLPDISDYDVVIGYRADDNYFQYAQSFVSNAMSLQCLNEMLQVGKLGKQIVVISQKGFERISFQEAYRVDASVFYPRFVEREGRAKKCYYEKDWRDGIFIMDILREEMIGDDKRIQQVL